MTRSTLLRPVWLLAFATILATPVTAARVNCQGGFAGIYPCANIDMLAHLELSQIGGGSGNDIWGWTDPLTGREYALVGRSSGTSFVDITDPVNAVYLGNLPTHSFSSTWRDIKVYANYAFIVSEASNHGMQVFDLTQLRGLSGPAVTFTETAHYNRFSSAHNVAIDEDTGFAYVVGAGGGTNCSGGLHMVDIRNPTSPVFAGCFSADGYTHDTQCVVYHGPDVQHQGDEICFNSNEDTLTVVDVTSKGAPVQLARKTYSGSGYTHQGWLTEDHHYFLLDDELDELNFGHDQRTYVWDVSDLENTVLVGKWTSQLNAIDHNQYVKGNYVYQSNYTAGLHILDLSGVAAANLTEVGYFDIYPQDINGPQGAGAPRHDDSFDGAWSVYPYYASGNVVVSGMAEGLFVLRPHLPDAMVGGSVVGLDTFKARCANLSSGAAVIIDLAGLSAWDCNANGLVISSGDPVSVGVAGLATGGTPVAGSTSGLDTASLVCRNVSSGQMVTQALAGGGDWDCGAAGLLANPGDRVAAMVSGSAQ